jgi:hypothetical protein
MRTARGLLDRVKFCDCVVRFAAPRVVCASALKAVAPAARIAAVAMTVSNSLRIDASP